MKNISPIPLGLTLWLCVGAACAQTLIVGHRGASYDAPENTVASAKLAWAQNADGVEIDVYLTPDKRVVVCHDKTAQRTGNQPYVIEETQSDTLRALDVGSWKSPAFAGEKMPFAEEIIDTVPPQKILLIELKSGPKIVDALKPIVERSQKSGQIAFISFNFDAVRLAKEAFPQSRCLWIFSKPKDLLANMETAAKAGLDGVDLKNKLITEAVMQKATALKLAVWTWVVDDPAEAKRLQDMGVTLITTDRPGWLRGQLSGKAPAPGK